MKTTPTTAPEPLVPDLSSLYIKDIFHPPSLLFADIDECASGANGCISGRAKCSNTFGSYICTCNDGYTGDGKTSCLSQGK